MVSIIDFITFGFIPSPNTMFENLFSINPGSFIEFSFINETCTIKESSCYWMPEITNEINNFDCATDLISASINESILQSMHASVDVACLFSGGIDSSLILSNARNINNDICAITNGQKTLSHQWASRWRRVPQVKRGNHMTV